MSATSLELYRGNYSAYVKQRQERWEKRRQTYNAERERLEKELGTVEPGKLADLILVDGNPLHDIRVLANVSWVMKEGQIIPRSPEWDRRPIKDPIQL